MNMLKPNVSVSTNHVKPEALSTRSTSLVRSSCFFRSIFDWNTRRSLLTISSSWSLPYSSGCADHKRASLLEGRGFKKASNVEILENSRKDFSGSEYSCRRHSAFRFMANLTKVGDETAHNRASRETTKKSLLPPSPRIASQPACPAGANTRTPTTRSLSVYI